MDRRNFLLTGVASAYTANLLAEMDRPFALLLDKQINRLENEDSMTSAENEDFWGGCGKTTPFLQTSLI